jgi:hypothetical protein
MNYKQITNEVKESRLLLQKAYERGYKQAETDYKKSPINWKAEPREGGIQFRCSGCNSYAIANYPHCPWCGCPVEKEEKK